MITDAANAASRRAILALADSPQLDRIVRKHGMRLGAARFVAGETLDELVPVLHRLENQGLLTNTTLLGEGVRSAGDADAVVAECKLILDRIGGEGLKTNLSVKLTHIGLVLGEELAYSNVAALVEHAKALGNFVRIDMEESAYVDATLRIYRRLREAGHANVGTVLQSYLYRSEADLASLLDLAPNLRLVKGAYLEPADVAFPDKADVDSCFVRLVERSLREGGFTAVATHDERLIEHVVGFTDREQIARGRFQFQLLYGVRPQLQLSLVARGYDVLVATPYGPDWYRYLMRRLAERPANTLFILKNLVRR